MKKILTVSLMLFLVAPITIEAKKIAFGNGLYLDYFNVAQTKNKDAQSIFEFTFPFMTKSVGDTKSLVRPHSGGVFKLVLDLSAADRIQASLVEQNGLKTTKLLSLDKDLNDAQIEILTNGCIDGLIMEADEDNYKMGIFSNQNNTGYVFDLEDSKKTKANFEKAEVVSKRLSFFFQKMNSKVPIDIKSTEANGSPAYVYHSDYSNISSIICGRMGQYGMTIVFILNEDITINSASGLTTVTFHSRENQYTEKVVISNKSKKSIYIIEKDKDLLNWLCKNDVYEITINGVTNEAFCSADVIRALIGKMK